MRRFFSKFFGGIKNQFTPSIKTVTTAPVGFVSKLSNFEAMDDEDIYDQFVIYEPSVGAAVDTVSIMVRQSFSRITLKNVGDKLDKIEEDMLEDANEIYDEVDMPDFIEACADVLATQGNVFLLENDDNTLTFLPNKLCRWVESKDDVVYTNNNLITVANYLTFNEAQLGEDTIIYPKDKIIHMKYKSTPHFVTDSMGAKTYNIYSVSPLHRVIIPIWRQRQMIITDLLMRWKNVPREHHKLNPELFNSMLFSGTPEQRRKAIEDAINQGIFSYAQQMQEMTPESNYVTTNVDIEMVETSNRNVTPTAGNVLLEQLDASIREALNIPSSMITGNGSGSYATELVMAGYVSSKIMHLSKKIKPAILKLLRARLKAINSAYPIDKLDILIELNMDAQKINIYREATIMKSLEVFTDDEVRTHIPGFEPLTDEQRENIKVWKERTTENIGDIPDPKHPDTPHSDASHSRVGDIRGGDTAAKHNV